MNGPVFYAVKVALRSDNSTVYLGAHYRNGTFERTLLDTAARFMTREQAEMHLEDANEVGPEVVALHSVTREKGDWRGWHETERDGQRCLNGPFGETVCFEPQDDLRAARHPWVSYTPEEERLVNPHGHARQFASALAARQALEKSMTYEYGGTASFRPD